MDVNIYERHIIPVRLLQRSCVSQFQVALIILLQTIYVFTLRYCYEYLS